MSDPAQRTITARDIDEWVRVGIITVEQADRIRARQSTLTRRFELTTIAYYAGGVTVLLAYTLFMGQQWQRFSAVQQSAIALFTIGTLWVIGYAMRRRVRRLAGDVLIFAGVGAVPIAVYSLQRLFGLGDIAPTASYRDYYATIAPAWLTMDVIALGVAALAVALTRFPLHGLLVGHWAYFLSLDAARWMARSTTWSWGAREQMIGLAVGLALLIAGAVLQLRATRNYSVWLYAYGFVLTIGNLTVLSLSSEPWQIGAVIVGAVIIAVGLWLGGLGHSSARSSFAIIGHLIVLRSLGALAFEHEGLVGLLFLVVYVAVVVASVSLQSRIFLVFGAIGCYSYVAYLAFRTFADTLGFPFVLAATGVVIVFSAVVYERLVKRWLAQRVGRLDPAATAT